LVSVVSSGEPSIVIRTLAPKAIVIAARRDARSYSAAAEATVTPSLARWYVPDEF
jgi:hypothetical protein